MDRRVLQRADQVFDRRTALRASATGGLAATLAATGLAAAAESTPESGPRVAANTQNPPAPGEGRANPNGRFAGKVVLITGATSGIGMTTAFAFAREGASVFFCGRREELGRANEAEIRAIGGEATYLRADVREPDQVQTFVDGCVETYGRIDVAFNNAGIETPTAAPLADQSLADWQNVMATNATGYFLSMKAEIPHMLNQGGGVIVNNGSVSSHVGFATIGPYNASKHAIWSLTRCAALDYGMQNIRVNMVSPGGVDTPMLERALEGFGMTMEEAAALVPIGRISTPDEIARVVMFLSSDDASTLHGMDVDATAGMLTM